MAEVTDGGGTKAPLLTSNRILARAAPLRQHRQPSVMFAAGSGGDALRHFLLEHQGEAGPERRPSLDRQPFDQKRGAHIVRQVGGDADARVAESRPHPIPAHRRNALPAFPARRGRSLPAPAGSVRRVPPQSPCPRLRSASARVRPPGPGPLRRTPAFGGARRAGDLARQVEIEQEILAQGFLGRQAVGGYDISKRRQGLIGALIVFWHQPYPPPSGSPQSCCADRPCPGPQYPAPCHDRARCARSAGPKSHSRRPRSSAS